MKFRQKKLWVSLALLSLVCLVGSASATNLVLNGGFELGNVDFTTDYTYVATPDPPLYEQHYAIGDSAYAYHNAWPANPPLAPKSGDNMMIVNGAQVANQIVWSQPVSPATIPVTIGATYYFSAWAASTYPDNPAQLAFSINGNSIGGLNLADPPVNGVVGQWGLFYATWIADTSTVNLALVNTNTFAGGNDFVLDDIKMDTVNPNVPVPGTVLLLGSGLAGLGLLRFRKKA